MRNKDRIRELGRLTAKSYSMDFLIGQLSELITIWSSNTSPENLSGVIGAASLIVIKHEMQGGLNICDKEADIINPESN